MTVNKKEKEKGIGFFERYLTLWVAICIVAGIAVGELLPGIPAALGRFEYANVSIPEAILIWLMIYPMMMKVDFQSIRNVGRKPKGVFITCIVNSLVKPVLRLTGRCSKACEKCSSEPRSCCAGIHEVADKRFLPFKAN